MLAVSSRFPFLLLVVEDHPFKPELDTLAGLQHRPCRTRKPALVSPPYPSSSDAGLKFCPLQMSKPYDSDGVNGSTDRTDTEYCKHPNTPQLRTLQRKRTARCKAGVEFPSRSVLALR